MNKKLIFKYFVTALILVIGVGTVQGVKLFRLKQKQTALNGAPSSRKAGPESAPIRIVEFIDYHCGPCGRGSKWLDDFMARHPQKIALEVEYFPLHKGPSGPISFQFAECALRQGKFWEAHRLIFERQYQWVSMLDPAPLFRLIAQEIGLDLNRLDACLKDESIKKEISRSKFKG
ncbi:MAG TPA: thioredoxin domain-containing protein, partial [Candidatus Omnitrophota bacterium]|nr:thioredoxin domain-containing protein [Candidatus Omnitrophota bacterium]